MKIMSLWLAKALQTAARTDTNPFLSDVYKKSTRARKRLADVSLFALHWLLPQNVPDTTQPDDDVYNLGTRRGRMQVDGALSQKSLLPENGTNATPFLSDVYNNRTRARKRLAGVSFSGRSMVEMLGVLAIIGVLSVGAISGYQKAMFKYKLNKQAQQISVVLNSNFIYGDHFKPLPAVLGSPSKYPLIPIYKKLEQIPLEMINKNYENEIFDIFGNMIYVLYINRVFDSYIETSIMLSQKEYLQCMNVLTVLKEFHGNLYDLFVYRQFSDSSSNDFVSKMAGDTLCTNNPYPNPCLKDLTLADMEKMCNVCSETESCRLGIRHHYK